MLVLHNRKLIVLFLLPALAFAQKPRGPISIPNIEPDSGPKQELSGDVKVPKNGKAIIPLFPAFKIPPTCDVKGATLPGEMPVFSPDNDAMHLKARPNGTLHYHCVGLAKEIRPESREKEGEPHPVSHGPEKMS